MDILSRELPILRSGAGAYCASVGAKKILLQQTKAEGFGAGHHSTCWIAVCTRFHLLWIP
jgi:hypothetical protein